MPVTMLDTVDFKYIPPTNFVLTTYVSPPAVTGQDEGRLIYDTTSNSIKYSDGVVWKELGLTGSAGPPTGAAGGALSGSYPDPTLVPIVNSQVAAGAAISTSKIAGLDTALSGKADNTITISAGNGLTGGGNLTAGRTISALAADASISVAVGGLSVVSAPKWTTGRTITLTGDTTGVSAAWDGTTALSFATVGVQAAKWTTGRTIALTGDVTGTSVAFDGTANLSFVTAIAAGSVVDADVSGAAAIQTSKISGLDTALAGKAVTSTTVTAGTGLTGGGSLAANMTLNVIGGTGITANADDIAINRAVTDTWYLQLSGGTLTNFLTLHADPTSNMHAATKQYVDVASQGFSFKQAVRCVSTTNVALSGLLTIDGITLVVGNRVLLAGQTTTSQNGVYIAASGAWTRATDMDASGELADGTLIPVAEGTLNADTQWMCTNIGTAPWVPGTNSSTWTKFSSLQDLQAGAGLLRTGNIVDIVAGDSSITVNADNILVASAPKWTTGRTISLTGDNTGTSAAFDGTGNLSIATVGVQAAKWTTGRTITLTGAVTGASAAWDGSANISFATTNAPLTIVDGDISASANIAQSKISGLAASFTAKADAATTITAGNGLTGGGTLAANRTISALAADATISVAVGGLSVVSAPKWQTARSITLTGDVTGTIASVDGTANISIPTTVAGGATITKKYALDLPATAGGVAISVPHALNTRDVVVEIYRTTTPWDTVYADVVRFDVNTVRVTFAAAITLNQYRVVVHG